MLTLDLRFLPMPSIFPALVFAVYERGGQEMSTVVYGGLTANLDGFLVAAGYN